MSASGRKHGWRDRLRGHVAESKEPLLDEDSLRECLEAASYDDIWYHNNFELEENPFLCLMLPMTVFTERLVHVTRLWDAETVCGIDVAQWCPPEGPRSTDEAIAWSKKYAGDPRRITCVQCIACAHYWRVFWWSPP